MPFQGVRRPVGSLGVGKKLCFLEKMVSGSRARQRRTADHIAHAWREVGQLMPYLAFSTFSLTDLHSATRPPVGSQAHQQRHGTTRLPEHLPRLRQLSNDLTL